MKGKMIYVALLVIMAGCIPPGNAGALNNLQAEIAANAVLDAGGILYGNPAKWRTIFDDFDLLNTAAWDTTSYFGGVVAAPDSTNTGTFYTGRPAIVATLNKVNNIVRLRWSGQGYTIKSGKVLEFETRFALSDTANCAWELGLIAAQDSLTGRGVDTTIGIGLRKRLGTSVTWWHKTTAGIAADSTASTVRLAPMTWYTIKFIYNGTSMRFYINGTLVKTDTAGQPTSSLKPVFEVRAGTTAVRKLYVDYMRVRQQR